MENKKLEVGEKYLSMSIGTKESNIRVALFPNKEKVNPTDPDYRGSIPFTCWVSKKKAESKEV
jgi:hypothetical protein